MVKNRTGTKNNKTNKEMTGNIPFCLVCTLHGDDRLQVLLALFGRQTAIVAVGAVAVGI